VSDPRASFADNGDTLDTTDASSQEIGADGTAAPA
jgi:hypothetical protein